MVTAAPNGAPQRLLIDTRGGADHATLKADLERAGNKVVMDLPQINMMVMYSKNPNAAQALQQGTRVASVAPDGIRNLIRPGFTQEFFGKTPDGKMTRTNINLSEVNAKIQKGSCRSARLCFQSARSDVGLCTDQGG